MGVALGTSFTLGLLDEVLENARFAEGVEALVDGMGVSVKTIAQAALQELVEVFFLYFIDEFFLLLDWVRWLREGIRFVFHYF